MLGRPKQGAPLIATRPATLDQVAPQSFEYQAQSPLAERTQVWDDLSLGFGLGIQENFADKKARYTICADTSIGGLILKGPAITTLLPATVDATNGVLRFFEVAGVLFALNGRYVQRRVSDGSWTLEKDFGVGKAATDVEVFASNGSPTPYAYVAMGDSEFLYRFDGSTWTQHTSLHATYLTMVARDLYRSLDTNQVSKVDTDADPWVAANWNNANSFRAGDKSSPITNLVATAFSQLVILKTDGIYTLDEAGNDSQLYPYMRFAQRADNGFVAGQYLNDLHTTYAGQHYRLKGTMNFGRVHLELEAMGPELLTENNGPVKGSISAFTGVSSLFAVGAIYDPDANTSHVLKFGGYLTPAIAQGQLDEAKRTDVWHGAISQTFTGAGKKITSLYVSGVGAASGHTRTYIGFLDGTVAWFANPCVPNPANCSSYPFTTNDGEVYLPFWHGQFKVDAKTLRSVTVAGTVLSPTLFAQFEYKTDPVQTAYAALGVDFNATPSLQAQFPASAWTTLADLRLLLKSSGGDLGKTPQVTAVALHHAVRPALVLAYEFDVLAQTGQVKRDGTPYLVEPTVVRNVIKTAAAAPTTTTFILPDESNQDLSITDYSEAVSWDERLRAWSAALRVKAIQVRLNTIFGTVDRLGAYTVDDLGLFTIDQLGVL